MKFNFFISSSNDDPSTKNPLLSSIKALNLLFSILYVGCDKSDIKIFVFKLSEGLLFNSSILDEKVVLLKLLINSREAFLSIDNFAVNISVPLSFKSVSYTHLTLPTTVIV